MDSLFTVENFNKICFEIKSKLPKDTELSKEIQLEIVEKIKEFGGNTQNTIDYFVEVLRGKMIRNIIYNTKTVIISLEKYKTVYIESLRFNLKIFNVSKKIGCIEPGYYTMTSLSKELEYHNIEHRIIGSERRIVVNTEENEISEYFNNFRFINSFHYITIVIPQLNWKKEIPIKNNDFFSFSIDEAIKIPASSLFDNQLSILFSCDSRQLEPNEIFFNMIYELR